MTDFATEQDVVGAALGAPNLGGRLNFEKASLTSVAGFLYSGWLAGGQPAAGATPGAAATVTQATTGALGRFVNAGGSKTNRLLELQFYSGSSGCDILYDRLAHMGGLSGTVATPTAQTVNVDIATAAAAGRCAADGSDVEWFLEWYTATGSTGVTATITYTNQAGTAGRTTTVTLPASVPASRLIPITVLAAGDTSIQSIQSVTLSATTGTAGNFGVTAAKRICHTNYNFLFINAGANGMPGGCMDYLGMKLPKIPDDACLWFVHFATTTSIGIRYGYALIGGR